MRSSLFVLAAPVAASAALAQSPHTHRHRQAELAAAGYTLAGEHAFLPEQYFLVFSPRR
jgi:hypothetical protein